MVFLGVLLLLASLPVVSAVVALRAGWRPVGDNALIGLRVRDVLRGRWPLTGQPTPGENFGSGIPTSHPGPAEFYLLAPVVAVLGPSWGLALGAAALNATAMAASAWIAFRRGGLALFTLASLAMMLLSRSLGGNLLHDPVSSQIGSMPAVLTLFAAWSLMAGDLRLVPVFLLSATFTLQDHLSYLVTVLPPASVAVAAALWWWLRLRTPRRKGGPRVDRAGGGQQGKNRAALLAGAAAAVAWVPVLWDEIAGAGNLGAVWRTFTAKRTAGEGLPFGWRRLLDAMSPPPIFSRGVEPLGWLRPPSAIASSLAVVAMLVAAALAAVAWRRRRLDLVALLVLGGAVGASGVYSALKLPVGAGIQASNLRWMWFVSMFGWLGMTWSLWSLAERRHRRAVREYARAATALLLAVVWLGTVSTVRLSTDRDGLLVRPIVLFSTNIAAVLPKGAYRVLLDGETALASVGPALVHDLDRSDYRLLVDAGPFTRAYTSERSYDGQEVEGTLMLTSNPGAFPPRGRFLASIRYAADPNRPRGVEPEEVRAYLVPGTPREGS